MPTLFHTTKSGVKLAYDEYGNKDANDVLIFSHGYCLNRHMFDKVIEGLLEDKSNQMKYRILAYDHRCHGDSDVVYERFTMDDLVEDGLDLIHHLISKNTDEDNKPNLHFLGMSTGGYVAQRILLKRPGLLTSVILMSTDAESLDWAGWFHYNAMLTILYWLGYSLLGTLVDETLRIQMSANCRNDPDRKDRWQFWKDQMMNQLQPRGIYYFGKAIFGRHNVLKELQDNPIPSLVMIGSDDIATPLPQSKAMHQALPNSKLVQIPNGGHMIAVELPALVTTALQEFLDSVTK